MDMGIDFSKIMVILVLILVFFGSKELPRFLREGAKLLAKVRHYSDKVKQEINTITSTLDVPSFPTPNAEATARKQELRKKHLAARKAASPEERSEKAAAISAYLENLEQFKNAGAVMMYINIGSEVETKPLIERMLRAGKRVLVPYSKSSIRTLGIGEISDLEKDIVVGEDKVPEPRPELRDRFYRSDLNLIVCPGVAFDRSGSRLGRGMGYYDNFLRELKGKVPIIGLAFDCQMVDGQLPFCYHDVAVNQIISESGFRLLDGIGATRETSGAPVQAAAAAAPSGLGA